MSLAYQYETTAASSTTFLVEKLTTAQQRIERSFLEGGQVLVAVIDAVSGLTKTLDGLTSLFDSQGSREVVDGMNQAVVRLAGLPAAAQSKQGAFIAISSLCDTVHKNVDEMREIIRYLRTIAVTLKITGASIPEFSGFSDEIRERIQSVSAEVDRFAGQLLAMRTRLEDAIGSSDSVIRDVSVAIPILVANMDRGTNALVDQQRRMVDTANELKRITGSIQMKISTVLSALQIGDITRQRIEHVVTLLSYYDDLEASDEARSLDRVLRARLGKAIAGLVKAQLEETVADFHQQCASIAGTIASFTANAGQVLSLRDELAGGNGQGDISILSRMQKDLTSASELSDQVLNRTRDLDTVVASVEESSQSLITGIAAIRRIKLDIFYMALNSNLACTKLGESGRAVNVGSGELRVFADRLEGPAEGIVVKMQEIESAKVTLTSAGKIAIDSDGHPLEEARLAVDNAAEEMSSGLAALSSEGANVFVSIDKAIRTLDFRSDLGDVLDDCLGIAASAHCDQDAPIAEGNSPIDQLSARIFKIYTMAHERDIHQRFLPVSQTIPAAESASDAGDDVLFDELF